MYYVLCLNVCRLCVPNIMSLGKCFKNCTSSNLARLLDNLHVKIRVIFGVRFQRWKVDKKSKPTRKL